ncbi:XrtA/PEP-CTERM system-associated ATPase [Novosphingobium taihuense]|uniref:Putative secretion ATPase (PEP-CTERM system associated) n=1 Tax=Novosphingobium taihuense TaxID=260085 RepID=A0A7W7ESQ3_9SPHN|nr:XrtA/PEP-CTERM system-associated ATPase [Novosphingobium taihuense]MBB4612543.1 putative secretion ATPase (PEP-CTERM system associated) [Novosphingobium taihuense]TWH88105.1 putative secretion ATPase (PEP-CTERM system associated) [Novosphingobium taihuense]
MYDEFYGLTGRPFQLTPDPRFYFESGTHRKALSYLGYGLAQGEGFIVITGEVGAGKSTLAAHLMATIDRQRLTAAQIVTSALDGEELIHVSARAFGLEVAGHDKATALAQIEAFLHHEAREGRRCLLVVDESQNLSVEALEELRMLSNFQLGAHPLLQILLLGQPEFRTLIQTSPELEQLRQRVIASHHLDAMEPAEVGAYVEHRLAMVGWQGRPQFDARVYADLAKASGGVPRRINQIVNRLMLMGAVEQRDHIDAAMLQAVLADLAGDGAFGTPQVSVTPAPAADVPQIDMPVAAAAAPVEAATVAPAPAFDESVWRAALAERDEQIAELQQAIIELADMRAAPVAPVPDFDLAAQLEEANHRIAALEQRPGDEAVLEALAEAQRRVAALESRTSEQEMAIRHTLTMLIEWIEAEDFHRAAA